PVLLPIISELGIDKIWCGVLIIVNSQLAYLSPPFGFVLFWIKGILPKDVHMGQVYGSVWHFIGMQLLGLILIYLCPEIALWLPRMLKYALSLASTGTQTANRALWLTPQ